MTADKELAGVWAAWPMAHRADKPMSGWVVHMGSCSAESRSRTSVAGTLGRPCLRRCGLLPAFTTSIWLSLAAMANCSRLALGNFHLDERERGSMRRQVRFIAITMLVLAASHGSNANGAEVSEQSAQLLPLKDVRLLDSPSSNAVKINRQYLLAHNPDRLLAPFRREAGLAPKARPYGNWESIGLDGHTAGHYLSALSLMMASGADSNGEFRRRLYYVVDQLEEIQKANGNGYLGGIPGSKDYWSRISDGNVDLLWCR